MLREKSSNTSCVQDQYTDRSGAVLVKIASTLKDKSLASRVVDTLYSMQRPGAGQTKEASFPVNTPEDALLSRVYFEGQREKLAADKAAEIDQRLNVYETLHSLPAVDWKNAFVTSEAPRTSIKEAVSTIALLPGCKIASKEDLFQAQKDFLEDNSCLTPSERATFAGNFVKAAAQLEFTDTAPKMFFLAGKNVEANSNLAENILLRKVAMERAGEESGYGALYDNLRTMNLAETSVEELQKLAETLEFADNAYNLHSRKAAKGIPPAWESVFQLKTAEEGDGNNTEDAFLPQTKAEVITRYGEGILEEVENPDGSMNMQRLKEIVRSISGAQNLDKKPESQQENAGNQHAGN